MSISICTVGHTSHRSCLSLRTGFYPVSATDLCQLSPPCYPCPLVYLLPPPAGQAKKKKSSSRSILFYPALFDSVATKVNLDQLRCHSRCLPALDSSGFLNALRLSLRPEDCLPVCTHTRRIWPGTLTSCQTHTKTHQNEKSMSTLLKQQLNLLHTAKQRQSVCSSMKRDKRIEETIQQPVTK